MNYSTNNDIIHIEEMIKVLGERLRILEIQEATFGNHCPTHIKSEINDVRDRINSFESILKKNDIKNTIPYDYRYKILTIDDEKSVTNLIKIQLSDFNFNIIASNSGIDGLRLATIEKPDLILLDVNIPDLHGYDILCKIKERRIPTRVVMMTGDDDVSVVVKFLKTGACNYIVKPFKIDNLVNIVKLSLEVDYTLDLMEGDRKEVIEKLISEIKALKNNITNISISNEEILRDNNNLRNSNNQLRNIINKMIKKE